MNDFFAGRSKSKADDSGASFCTKFVFFILLVSFCVTGALFMLDYKQGQLNQLKSQLPPEVHEAVEKAGKLLADFLVKVKAFNTQVLLKAEELSAKIQIGDKTLADYIFNAKQQKVI